MNKNGIQDGHVPVFVEPINDPPIINAPKFIFVGKKEATDGLQIFDKQRDVFEFSISDSDIFNFPGMFLNLNEQKVVKFQRKIQISFQLKNIFGKF